MDDPKLCKDCAHFSYPSCRSPENMKQDLVNGGIRPYNTPAYLREAEDKCGPKAKWFEPIKVAA